MIRVVGLVLALFAFAHLSQAGDNPTVGKAFLGISTGIQQPTNGSAATSFALGGLLGYNIANPFGISIFYYPQIGSTTAQIGGDFLLNFGNAIRVFTLGARASALIGGTGSTASFGGKAALDYFVHPDVTAGLEIVVQGGASASFIMAVANLKLWM